MAEKDGKRIITGERMKQAEFMRQDWVVNAEEGTSIEQVLDPVYWSHMAPYMSPFDRIEVRMETGEWLLELLVMQVARSWAQVHVLNKYDLVEVSEPAPTVSGLMVKWRGPQHKHCVVRVSDGHVLQSELSSAKDAGDWISNYQMAVAR